MLSRVHRITDGADLRRVVRKGSRRSSPFFVISSVATPGVTSRVGFIVSKRVGGAVVRNRVKRRLRELAHLSLRADPTGRESVVRALPASAQASYRELARAWERSYLA